MAVRPLNDWLVVRADPDAKETEAGIIMAGMRDIHKKGTVLAVGPGRISRKGVRLPMEVKPGERVLYVFALEKTETGKAIKASLDAEDEFMIRENDILAVIEEA
jgi:chaperonin GroES